MALKRVGFARFLLFFVLLNMHAAELCADEKKLSALENYQKQEETLKEALALAENIVIALEARAADIRTGVNALKSNITNELQQISSANYQIRKIDEHRARLNSLGELGDIWAEYKNSRRTKQDFKKLFRSYHGKDPDDTDYIISGEWEDRIRDQIVNKAIGPIGDAMVKIGELVIKAVSIAAPTGSLPNPSGAASMAAIEGIVARGGGMVDEILGAWNNSDLRKEIVDSANKNIPGLEKLIGDGTLSSTSTFENLVKISKKTLLFPLGPIPGKVQEYLEKKKMIPEGVAWMEASENYGKAASTANEVKQKAYDESMDASKREPLIRKLELQKTWLEGDLIVAEKNLKELQAVAEKEENVLMKKEQEIKDVLEAVGKMHSELKDIQEKIIKEQMRLDKEAFEREIAASNNSGIKYLGEKDFTLITRERLEENQSGIKMIALNPATEAVTGLPQIVHFGIRGELFEKEYFSYARQTDRGFENIKGVKMNSLGTFNNIPFYNLEMIELEGANTLKFDSGEIALAGKKIGTAKISFSSPDGYEISDNEVYPRAITSNQYQFEVVKIDSVNWFHDLKKKPDQIDLFTTYLYPEGMQRFSRNSVVVGPPEIKLSNGMSVDKSKMKGAQLQIKKGDAAYLSFEYPGIYRLESGGKPGNCVLETSIKDANGKTAFEDRIAVTNNYVSFLVKLPERDETISKMRRPDLIPIGDEVKFSIQIQGPAQMSNYQIKWNITSGKNAMDINASAFRRINEAWVADLRVSFNPKANKEDFLEGTVSLVDDENNKVAEFELPRFKPAFVLESIKLVQMFDTMPMPIRDIHLFCPAGEEAWKRNLNFEVKAKGISQPFYWWIEDADFDGPIYVNNSWVIPANEANQKMSSTEVGKRKITVRANESDALSNGFIVKQGFRQTFNLDTFFNRFELEAGQDENGKPLHVLVCYGPSPLSSYKVTWSLEGVSESKTFKQADGVWKSTVPADKAVQAVYVYDNGGRRVSFMEKAKVAESQSKARISLPELPPMQAGKKALIRVSASDMDSGDDFDYLTIGESAYPGARFTTAEYNFGKVNGSGVGNLVLQLPAVVPPEGVEVPYTVSLYRVYGKDKKKVFQSQANGKVMVLGSISSQAAENLPADQVPDTSAAGVSAGDPDWTMLVEKVTPLGGNNPLDLADPVTPTAKTITGVTPVSSPSNSSGSSGTNNGTQSGDTGPVSPPTPPTPPPPPPSTTAPIAAGSKILFTKAGDFPGIYANVVVDPNTGAGKLTTGGDGQDGAALIFQFPGNGDVLEIGQGIEVFPDSGGGQPVWQLKKVPAGAQSKPGIFLSAIVNAGQSYTYELVSLNGREIEITATVIENNPARTPANYQNGDLELRVDSSKTIKSALRAVKLRNFGGARRFRRAR